MYTGGAGGYSFYVRKGEQVIRQRKNNSNYGSGASRTYAQMIRRIKWGNLVNVFKAMKTWQPKAYDSKKQGQTDYNIFMQLNINRATAALTREMCLSGCAVIEPCQVSRGSLPPIALALAGSGNQYVSDIVISNAITGSTTVGQLSADILANNPQFQEGDNLAFCFFYNWKDSRVEWPFVSTKYTEITLNSTSSVVINSIPALDNRLSKSTGGNLQASWSAGTPLSPNNEVGMVLIHTRKSASMLAVSSQEIVVNGNSILSSFVGNTWYQTCIDTYGLTDEVPLDPSFRPGTITSVTANSVEISDGDILNGQQTIRVYGDNLYSPNFKLIANNVVYTPLEYGEGYIEYFITANADIILQLNGHIYLSFHVEGIDTPSELTGFVSAGMFQSGTPAEVIESTEGGCLNYAHLLTSEYVGFRITVEGSEAMPDLEAFSAVNGVVSRSSTSAGRNLVLNIGQIDRTKPCYMLYNDFIVFVGNYVA